MFNAEKKLLQFLESHINILAVLGTAVMGIIIRISFQSFYSGDMLTFLLEWYEQIKAAGGIKGLGEQVGNYNILYQTVIALITYLPLEPVAAYKLVSVVFDYILAGIIGIFLYRNTGTNSMWKGILAFALVLLSPVVFVNSSMWAQCDSIYTTFVVLSLIMMFQDKFVKSLIFLGIALSFKLQAVFILPLYLFLYFYKKRYSILYFAILPGILWLSSLPGILMGRGLLSAFIIYFRQSREESSLTVKYPSFWVLFVQDKVDVFYHILKPAAMIFTVSILVVWMVYWIWKKVELNISNMLAMALITVYTCVLFLPGMHERYGFVYEILALIYVFYNVKSVWLLLALNLLSVITYGQYICNWEINLVPYSVVNVIVYAGYCHLMTENAS